MLRNMIKDRQTMMSIGMIALILANVSHYLLHPGRPFSGDLIDGIFGMLIGISIGCNLLSLRRHDRQSA
jgi:hypothetical protein